MTSLQFFKRRLVVSRLGISLGIKICVLLSIFIVYHLFQESRLETTGLVPFKAVQIIQTVNVESAKYHLTSLYADTSSNEFKNYSKKAEHEDGENSDGLKFIFVLQHYEQLTKTTENLFHLGAVAKQIDRVIVEPFVRDSRMCGLPYGWSGAPRSERRRFYPLSLYFDVQFMNNLLNQSAIAPMVKLETFKRHCRSSVANTTLLHFMFNDRSLEEMERWYKISAPAYRQIEECTKKAGWCDCNFIDRGLNVSNRIGDIRAGRQICIDAERVKSVHLFKREILRDDVCVVIIHWRGFGRERSHFKPEVQVSDRKLVYSLRSSAFVLEHAKNVEESIGEEYISIHIRSERQIAWYDVERLSRCLKTLVTKATDLKKKSRINKIFVSADFTRFGSDTLQSFTAQNKTLTSTIKKLKRFLFKTLKPMKYNPKSDDPLVKDSGVVALTEMNVLTGGLHLMTVGSGTFQEWIVHGFVARKVGTRRENNWTITRICHKEEKLNNYKPS